jgi:hypothetical protein
MKSTGAFSLLDEKLKNTINNYNTEWKWRLGPTEYNVSSMYVEKWRDALMQEGINKSHPFETTNPVKILKDDPYKTVLISQLIEDSAWSISTATHLDGLAEELIMEVEKEIMK